MERWKGRMAVDVDEAMACMNIGEGQFCFRGQVKYMGVLKIYRRSIAMLVVLLRLESFDVMLFGDL